MSDLLVFQLRFPDTWLLPLSLPPPISQSPKLYSHNLPQYPHLNHALGIGILPSPTLSPQISG